MTFASTVAGEVPIDDDHGTGLAATLLPLDRPLAGRLSDMADVDAFRIDLIAAARVEVRTSGGTDTRGRLLDGSGAVRAEDDDSGPGANFRLVAALAPGAHYVEVQGAPGDYSVTARLADALDQGETEAASTLLTLREEQVRGATSILVGAPGRIWPSVSDVDVFRLDVPHDGTDGTVRSSGSTALRARLTDSSGVDIASRDRRGNVRMERRLDAGTYYVVVGGDEVGAYRLLATGVATSDPCARPPVARDDGSSPESSTVLEVGGPPTAGTIDDDADVDVFRLDLEGSAQVELRTSGGTDTRGELYDSRGDLIAADEASGPGGHNFRIVAELAAGIYYLAVTGAHGTYAVSARAGRAFDHPDAPRTATRLRLHSALDLARVTPDILLGTAGRIWPSTADVDAFRLDVTRDGTVVRVRTSGGTPLHARLVHAGEPSVAVAADDRGGDIDLETPLGAGVYYLLVGGHDTGAYRVLAWGYQAGDAPPDKAAFDELVAGRSLSGPFLDTVRFCAARGFAQDRFTRGDYTYERGACPHTGWLELEYRDGGRCTTMLSFDSADTGIATFSCDDESGGTSRFSLVGGGKPARIPDRRLAVRIQYQLGKRWCDNEPITVADMASLTSLDASNSYVRDLTGLEQATELIRLDLSANDISDLEPLTGLTALKSLDLRDNRISDLSPLAELTSLTSLGLGRNEISDLRPLTGLTSLTSLSLDSNEISDLSPLPGLAALDRLFLRDNRISDLSPLADLTSLTSLDLSRNEISDLLPLAGLATLERLYLRDNRISDLSPLTGLTSLGWLYLSYNQISDLGPLWGLGLVSLDLAGNRILDLKPLTGLAALGWLNLADNRVADLTPLANSTSLNDLDLSLNGISDLKPLADLRFWRLDLAGNRISDVSPLAGEPLSEASFLDLSDNDITDIAPLSGMTSIGYIDLAHNEIADLSPFSDMSLYDAEDFPEIRLQGNRITDASPLTPLLGHTAFYWNGTIDLGHNELVDVPDFDYLPADLDVAGNRIASLGGRSSPRYSLNVEGNVLAAVPRANSLDLTGLYLAGNAISEITALLSAANDVHAWTVSLWRNPLDRHAREVDLPSLRDLAPGGVPLVHVVGGGQVIPLLADFPPPRGPDRRGVLRLTNLGLERDAWLYAPRLGDDARPAAVVLPSRSVIHVDAKDVREGARKKRVYGELPIGSGDAVLEVFSSGTIRAHAYVRSADGFLTSVHDTVSADATGRHVVPFFNPASNTPQRSLLRLVNMGGADTEVFVTGVDDAGAHGGPVKLVLAARSAATLDAEALENGTGAGMSGRLGNGEGRWRLDVSSDGKIAVASLVDGPTGHLTNLSTVALENTVPLFPSASHPGHRGWVRIVNRGDTTEVDIRGTDDAGTEVGPVTIRIAAGRAVEFDADDWEHGNAAIGLGRGVGRGTGNWRLRLLSEGDILVGAYVETQDGFLSSIHDRAPRADESVSDCLSWWHRWQPPGLDFGRSLGVCRVPPMYAVAPFMPPGDDGPVSSVRLTNDGDDDAAITIWRVDERGNRAGPVELVLAAGTARTVSARELVEGGEGLAGWLRNGAGTWELLLTSSGGRITVVNLLEDSFGHVTNLSTAPYQAVIDEYR